MKDQDISAPSRRTTKINISAALVARAKEMGVNVSQAAEQGVEDAVAKRMGERWLEENQEALISSNAFVEAHGLPLAKYRPF
ncbi:type II toxin-antitoxin system CcdA family antitoxin [Paucibacter sp. KCTC 42545]|uniref:type II toxin-antitoxin system CcdA family antitoxin n=1 Tax=Paucibacter sp. KCTC 42545 TaxID=1768242 RepID=UPI000733A80F|nr:type II toxin-antitoxin system CcdA family antitoxin [Paucibacter sp. KCTC 42545]ALT79855.1 post-segregation antitoxin CcdA [Paucibacter sp. KCTC 42545]